MISLALPRKHRQAQVWPAALVRYQSSHRIWLHDNLMTEENYQLSLQDVAIFNNSEGRFDVELLLICNAFVCQINIHLL